jgi:hypothetical protein
MNQLIAFLKTIGSRKILRLCASPLSANVCKNMADPTHTSGVGGGYVDYKIINLSILNSNRMKEISFVN